MATKNTSPVIPATPRIGLAAIATANANRDGTGTVGTVITGTAEGTVVDRVRIKATVTTTAGMIRLFLHNGSAFFLIKEIAVSAITPSATVAAFESEWVPDDLILPDASHSLRAATEKAENHVIAAHVRDY